MSFLSCWPVKDLTDLVVRLSVREVARAVCLFSLFGFVRQYCIDIAAQVTRSNHSAEKVYRPKINK
jgi:hypothetical protein